MSGFDDGFLPFSSSTPHSSPGGPRGGSVSGGSHFKPKRGKSNRQDNWKQFGEHMQRMEGGQDSGPSSHMGYGKAPQPSPQQSYFYSSQNSPRQNFRGGPPRGGFRGFGGPSPNFRGHRGGFRPHRGFHSPNYRGHRGRGHSFSGHNSNQARDQSSDDNRGFSSSGYFHPSMLEDPWAKLQEMKDQSKSSQAESESAHEENDDVKMSDSLIPQVRHPDLRFIILPKNF